MAKALSPQVPSYLKDYAALYARDPRKAAVEWFRRAERGLFMHYGLYSLLGRHEWVQYNEKIRPADYAALKDRFFARQFDADFITDLALEAGMKYVNLTTRHHDSFCLFQTKQTDFNSVNSPARRDLVADLAAQCAAKGLGLFLYYSHGRDWKHPHAPNNDEWGSHARPEFDPPERSYATGKRHDLNKYVDFISAQITELLTQYGPVAGIWLDGYGVPKNPRGAMARRHDPDHGKDLFRLQELYDLIHSLQPQALVAYKWGYLGTEDFFAPEHSGKIHKPRRGKPLEICTTLQGGGWGYVKKSQHHTIIGVRDMLAAARKARANLLLNTGPLPGGSIHKQDVKVLRELGKIDSH
ncbi:MAG: alpha-L-fucosidase [Planctomycetaceae bacterium]|nr:alpha-L-fucosidase [Planctomycetaceae bacterium]